MDETHFVGEFAKLRNQCGNHLAGFATRCEFPGASCEHSLLTLERQQVFRARQGFAVLLDQLRLVIEGVNLAAGSGTEYHQYVPGRGFVMGITRRKRPAGIDLWTEWCCFLSQEMLVL